VRLIAGLGNPGPRYAGTRHNVGFLVVEELARRWQVRLDRYERDFEALVGEANREGRRVLLIEPQTLMNLSGRSVAAVQRFYKLEPADLLVVLDDVDLPVGRIRLRASGSSGGHRGLENILQALGRQDVPRLRIGIGKVHASATVAHVLSRFAPDEREPIAEAITLAADAVEFWLSESVEAAMTRYNRRGDEAMGTDAS